VYLFKILKILYEMCIINIIKVNNFIPDNQNLAFARLPANGLYYKINQYDIADLNKFKHT